MLNLSSEVSKQTAARLREWFQPAQGVELLLLSPPPVERPRGQCYSHEG